MAEALPRKNLAVVLLGRIGHGKSATGNAILGGKVFEANASQEPVTTEVKCQIKERGHYVVEVVDTPGLSDTGFTLLEDKKKAVQSMRNVFLHCGTGVHVFALFVRFDTRLIQEEKDVFQTLKSIFGNRYLKDNGMVIVTHGDDFSYAMKEADSDMTFEEWIRKDDLGPIGDLFKECDYRCVLFDNRTKDDRMKTEQLDKFFTVAEILRNKGIYSNEYFQKFENERNQLIDHYQLPYMKRSIQNKIKFLKATANGLAKGNANLTQLKRRVDGLLNEVEKAKNRLLNDLKSDLQKIKEACEKKPWKPEEIKEYCDQLKKYQKPPYGYWEAFNKFGLGEVCYALFGYSELHIG